MTCKDCIHYDKCMDCLCRQFPNYKGRTIITDSVCEHFKNKSDFVEVEVLKSWLYSIATNNVGCDIKMNPSEACEDIISRLDGLRVFAKENHNKIAIHKE